MRLYYECTCGFIGQCDSEDNYLTHEDEQGNEMTVCLPENPSSWMKQIFDSHEITIVTAEQLRLERR